MMVAADKSGIMTFCSFKNMHGLNIMIRFKITINFDRNAMLITVSNLLLRILGLGELLHYRKLVYCNTERKYDCLRRWPI